MIGREHKPTVLESKPACHKQSQPDLVTSHQDGKSPSLGSQSVTSHQDKPGTHHDKMAVTATDKPGTV